MPLPKHFIQNTIKPMLGALLAGFIVSVFIFAFKHITEKTEHWIIRVHTIPALILITPLIGLTLIFLLRKFIFKREANKGIREITDSLKTRFPHVPIYKFPSHIINGFITIISGGSTGIEVSSVVASGAVGSYIGSSMGILKKHRAGIICAAVAAAITSLFNSPLAGIFFAYEVMYKKVSRPFAFLAVITSLLVWLMDLFYFNESPIIPIYTDHWNYYAIPLFILLGVLAGVNSTYMTRLVIEFKKLRFLQTNPVLSLTGLSLVLGALIVLFPGLYGEGYSSIQNLVTGKNITPLIFVLLLLVKPLVVTITLSAGGDGGVFAPSLFTGAFLGGITAFICNSYFGMQLVPENFILAGMAAVLCASIHAPLTAIFVVCGLTGNYSILIPLVISCLVARITSHYMYPYSVYNFPLKNSR